MLASESITFMLGDNDFEASFSLDGFSAVADPGNQWLCGKRAESRSRGLTGEKTLELRG